MRLFLDLEQTVIETWDSPVFCNIGKVFRFIKLQQVDEVSIFSFAIYDEKDKAHFDSTLRLGLEDALQTVIVAWPSVDDIIRTVLKHQGTNWSRHEFMSVWGKGRAFIDYCRATQQEDTVLLDDAVDDEEWSNLRTGLKFKTLNINRI